MRTRFEFVYCRTAVTVAATFGLASTAAATLRVDLEVTGATGSAYIHDGNIVSNLLPGDRVDFDVVAYITDTDPSDNRDGLIRVGGAIYSYTWTPWNDALGSMTATRTPLFTGPRSSDGQQRDIDGDGDLDVGGPEWNDPPGWFIAESTEAPQAAMGTRLTIGRGSFTYESATSAIGGAGAWLVFAHADFAAETQWIEDGQLRSSFNGNIFREANGIQVYSAPEPATAAALAVVATFASALRPRRQCAAGRQAGHRQAH